MATSVATPLERQIGQISGVTQMTSFSALGATSITIQFDLNRNIDSAAQDVQAAITAASRTLPESMTTPPPYKKLNPADAPILMRDEGPAQVVRLGHRGTPSVTCSDEVATPSPPAP
jgi:multidrug efflux pump subunit AcrB